MICQRKGCGGEVDKEVRKNLPAKPYGDGVFGLTPAFPCGKCGLLHFSGGQIVVEKDSGKAAFLTEGEIVSQGVILE